MSRRSYTGSASVSGAHCSSFSALFFRFCRLRQDADGTLFVSEKKERKLSVPGGKAGLFPEDAYTSKE